METIVDQAGKISEMAIPRILVQNNETGRMDDPAIAIVYFDALPPAKATDGFADVLFVAAAPERHLPLPRLDDREVVIWSRGAEYEQLVRRVKEITAHLTDSRSIKLAVSPLRSDADLERWRGDWGTFRVESVTRERQSTVVTIRSIASDVEHGTPDTGALLFGMFYPARDSYIRVPKATDEADGTPSLVPEQSLLEENEDGPKVLGNTRSQRPFPRRSARLWAFAFAGMAVFAGLAIALVSIVNSRDDGYIFALLVLMALMFPLVVVSTALTLQLMRRQRAEARESKRARTRVEVLGHRLDDLESRTARLARAARATAKKIDRIQSASVISAAQLQEISSSLSDTQDSSY